MGAKPSGAEYRRRRQAADEQARREEAERRAAAAAAAGTGVAAELPPHLAHYGAAGPPPLDAVRGIAWANKIAQSMLHEIVTDPVIGADKRRAQGAALLKVIGQTAGRAQYEERIDKLWQQVDATARGHGRRAELEPVGPDAGTPLRAPPKHERRAQRAGDAKGPVQ